MNQSELFKSTLRIRNEVDKILQKGIIFSENEKSRLRKNFKKSLQIKDLLGSFKYHFFFIALIISIIIFIILLATLSVEIYVYFFIFFGIIGFSFLMGYIGSFITKSNRNMILEDFIDFYFDKLVDWTKKEIDHSDDKNLNRILFENLISCFYDVIQYKRISLWNLNLKNNVFRKMVSSKKYVELIKLSISLFEVVFTKNKRYNKKGILIISKIFQPFLFISKNYVLCEYINRLDKHFFRDTNINPSEFYKVEIKKIKLKKKIHVNQDYLKKNQNVLDLFENLWETKEATQLLYNGKTSLRLTHTNRNSENANNKSHYVTSMTNRTLKKSIIEKDLSNNNVKTLSNYENPGFEEFAEIMNNNQKEKIKKNDIVFMKKNKSEDSIIENSFDISINSKKNLIQELKNGEIKKQNLLEVNNFEFPLEKRQVPKTSDPLIEKLLAIEKEDLSIYKLVLKKGKTRIYKKMKEGSPVILLRTHTTLDYSAEKMFHLLYNLDERSKWDKVFSMKIVKIIDEKTDIIYGYVKGPPFISDRDFVQKRVTFKGYQGIDFVIGFEHFESEEFPKIKKAIRAETIISGYVIRKVSKDKTDISLIAQTDIKGVIPKYIFNKLSQKAPLDWIKKFEKALAKFNKE